MARRSPTGCGRSDPTVDCRPPATRWGPVSFGGCTPADDGLSWVHTHLQIEGNRHGIQPLRRPVQHVQPRSAGRNGQHPPRPPHLDHLLRDVRTGRNAGKHRHHVYRGRWRIDGVPESCRLLHRRTVLRVLHLLTRRTQPPPPSQRWGAVSFWGILQPVIIPLPGEFAASNNPTAVVFAGPIQPVELGCPNLDGRHPANGRILQSVIIPLPCEN